MKKVLLLCLMAWWPHVSRAGDVFTEPCARAGIPRELAVAIARQESSLNPLALNIQGRDLHPRSVGQALEYIRWAEARKKSYDVGLMQINNQWFGKLGITAEELLDPQRNVETGVRILAAEIRRHGFNWLAVGKYHSPDRERGRRYAWRVWRHLMRGTNGTAQTGGKQEANLGYQDTSEHGGIWRNSGIQPKGRLITFRVRQKRLPGQTDRESGGSAGPAGTAEGERRSGPPGRLAETGLEPGAQQGADTRPVARD